MPYLFQISIGPVQSFIQEARRTRDLKFGSWFLNELAWVAATKVANICGNENLIFPALLPNRDNTFAQKGDAPNKILAYIPIDATPADLAYSVKTAIDNRVDEIRKGALRNIESRIVKASAEKQIHDLVEYTWAALQFDKERDSYEKARQMLDALITARKNTRDFIPVDWGSSNPKSSIDGKLESVIPEAEYPRLDRLEYKSNEEKQRVYRQVREFRETFGAGPHEKLSGIDLIKRLGGIDDGEHSFPSTSHMAALPFLQRLSHLPEEQQQLAKTWKNTYLAALGLAQEQIHFELDRLPKNYWEKPYWTDVFPLDNYDGALLYPERFPDVVGDNQIFREAQKAFQDATNILENFYTNIKLCPNPYYVLLAADGDHMGVTIDWQAREGLEKHQVLSRALAQFARNVTGIVKSHAGVCIYAGGDDVLALLPLHKAVQCARALADAFSNMLKPFLDEQGRSPTLSVGLAVVHHLHPLGDALRIARDTEGRAKSGEKNALAITVKKRGGPPCMVGGKWDTFDQRLQRQIELCQKGIIPTGMAYELKELALRLEPEAEQLINQPTSPPYVQYAALRVFQRKLDEAKRRGYSSDEISKTLNLLKEMIGLEYIQPVRVGSLADELIVARLFTDALLLANGESEGGKA